MWVTVLAPWHATLGGQGCPYSELRLHSFAPSSQVHACACCPSGACRYFARQPSCLCHSGCISPRYASRWTAVAATPSHMCNRLPSGWWLEMSNPTAAESSLQGKLHRWRSVPGQGRKKCCQQRQKLHSSRQAILFFPPQLLPMTNKEETAGAVWLSVTFRRHFVFASILVGLSLNESRLRRRTYKLAHNQETQIIFVTVPDALSASEHEVYNLLLTAINLFWVLTQSSISWRHWMLLTLS